MRPALSRVPGVGNVEVLASDTREIEVIADPARLTASGLTIGDVADALQAANTLQPVGRYDAGGLQHLVLASGMWKNVRDIPDTPLVIKGGATIRVSDVATVQQGAPDRTTLVTGDGAVAANISVSQQVGSNILDVRAGVETALADLAKTLPAGLELSKTYDLAEFVATAIANVRDAILIGSVLAVIVLLVFLRDWRLTLVASVTLPLTVMTTFLVMRWLGETINVMSMGGLAVAIGLVIDDAVVVVENIYRHLDKGEASTQAVQLAMKELIAPVVGSTLTTVVVFVPLGMLSGVIGQFFRALSITLASAVLISLVQALTLIPLLARVGGEGPRETGRQREHTMTRAACSSASIRARSTPRCGVRSSASSSRSCLPSPACCSSCGSAAGSCRPPTRVASSSITTPRPGARCPKSTASSARWKACSKRRRRSPRSPAVPDRSSASSQHSRRKATFSSG